MAIGHIEDTWAIGHVGLQFKYTPIIISFSVYFTSLLQIDLDTLQR